MKELLKGYGTKIQDWYPLGGRGNNSVLNEEIIGELADKYGKSPAQIILKWHNQTDASLEGFAKWNPDFDAQK